MNRALSYLFLVLLKRKALRFCSDLRRPTRLIGAAALFALAGFLFHFRRHEFFEPLIRSGTLTGCALVMLGGSLFRGFSARGLAFEPADAQFLFSGPFSSRQIIFYRLLPNYLFALLQGFVFLGLFGAHLSRPLTATLCFVLFQAVCFHAATAAALFGAGIPLRQHQRIRWMLLGAYFLLTAVYLRTAWDIRIVPPLASSPWVQLFFYPAVTIADGEPLAAVQSWARGQGTVDRATAALWLLYPVAFATAAAASLRLVLALRADFFESSLATTTQAAERRLRLRDGRRVVTVSPLARRSAGLPRPAFFQGVGAVVWKNLVIARRSRRELALAFVFTLIFTLPLAALLRYHDQLLSQGIENAPRESAGFHIGIAIFIGFLAFLLQRTLPFDFRLDGHDLARLRTLPARPLAVVLAEIAVPTGLCLAFQALGVGALVLYARLDPLALLLVVLAYPAIALAVNGIWNLHYLTSAARRAGGRPQSASAVGTLLVVAVSFLIFYPAGWTAERIFDRHPSIVLAAAGFLGIQYAMDILLLGILATLFRRSESTHDNP